MQSCPLCNTPILDPHDLDSTEINNLKLRNPLTPPYNDSKESLLTNSFIYHRGLLGGIISFILIIGIVTTLIIDLSINQHITWSFYPMLSLATVWGLVVFPILYHRRPNIITLVYDALFLAVFLLLLDNYGNGVSWGWFPATSLFALTIMLLVIHKRKKIAFQLSLSLIYIDILLLLFCFDLLTHGNWFFPLALPIVSVVWVSNGLFILGARWAHKNSGTRPQGYLYTIFICILIILISMVTNVCISSFTDQKRLVSWAYSIAVSVVPIAIFSFIAYHNSHIYAYIRKKFHL